MSKTTLNKKRTPKTDEEILAESAILKAGQVRELINEVVKKSLTEKFAPAVRNAITDAVDTDYDFKDELEPTMEDEDVDTDAPVVEDEPTDAEIDAAEGDDDVDLEGEESLEESDEVEDFESSDEESFEDEETFEEATDEEAEFLAELERLIESEGAYEDDEDDMESMDEDYNEWSSEKVKTNVSNQPQFINESEDEEDDDMEELDENYAEWTSEKVQTNTSNQPRFVTESKKRGVAPAKKRPTREQSLVKENETLRKALRRNMKTLEGITLDLERNKEFNSLVENFTLKSADKLHIMESLDRGASSREIKNIADSLRKAYRSQIKENSKRTAIGQSNRTAPKKEGRNRLLAGKTDLQVKKSVKESQKVVKESNSRSLVDQSFFDNMLRLAGVDPKTKS